MYRFIYGFYQLVDVIFSEIVERQGRVRIGAVRFICFAVEVSAVRRIEVIVKLYTVYIIFFRYFSGSVYYQSAGFVRRWIEVQSAVYLNADIVVLDIRKRLTYFII